MPPPPFRHRRGVVVICSRLVGLQSLQRCVRAPARCLGLCRRPAAPRRAAAPHAAEAFCLGNANAAVAASFREKAVAVYGPDKQPWRLS